LDSDTKILLPNKLSLSDHSILSTVETLQGLANDLDRLIKKLETLNNSSGRFDNAFLFLGKSLRYINSAIQNETSNEHFASFKMLRIAANNLENFLNDEEQSSILDMNTDTRLRILVNQLKTNSESIEKINFPDSESPPLPPPVAFNTQESNISSDWILSDFNLSSNDFSAQLSFIAGNLFDLNFSYQLCRVLNANCLLMKNRQDTTEEAKKYVLKVCFLLFFRDL